MGEDVDPVHDLAHAEHAQHAAALGRVVQAEQVPDLLRRQHFGQPDADARPPEPARVSRPPIVTCPFKCVLKGPVNVLVRSLNVTGRPTALSATYRSS